MKKIIALLVACMFMSIGLNSIVFADQEKAPDLNVDKSRMIVDQSRIVIEEMMLNLEKEKAVPVDLIKNCAGLAIIPGMFKGAIVIGGSYGKGIVLKHERGKWSGPAFFNIGAGSFGLQLGGQSVDLILVILGQQTMDSFLKTKFKLGGGYCRSGRSGGRPGDSSHGDLFKRRNIFLFQNPGRIYRIIHRGRRHCDPGRDEQSVLQCCLQSGGNFFRPSPSPRIRDTVDQHA